MSIKPDILALRALNACRLIHKPSYVALRALFNGNDVIRRLLWISKIVEHKARIRQNWTYHNYPVFKEFNKDSKTPDYRIFTIGSPLTLMVEAYILDCLSREEAFKFSPHIYSYLWPKSPRSTRSYLYYHNGYASRNVHISNLLISLPNHVALVTDIRRFYPSISWKALIPRLENRLTKVHNSTTARIVHRFVEGLKETNKDGIPVGPEISHVLGNIALERVDEILTERYGHFYCRYVDDIVIVCDQKDSKTVRANLEEVVRREGFELNEDKTDIVTASDWLKYSPTNQSLNERESFSKFMEDLSLYIALKPYKAEGLKKAFRSEGFSIPIDRLRTQIRYGPFWEFLLSKFSKLIRTMHLGDASGQGLLGAANIWEASDNDFITRANKLRQVKLQYFITHMSQRENLKGTRARWEAQRFRYYLYRLLYLHSKSTFNELLSYIPTDLEYESQRILLESLSSGNILGILKLPGASVSAFCELFDGNKIEISSTELIETNQATLESTAAISTCHEIDIQQPINSSEYSESSLLINLLLKQSKHKEAIKRGSYIEEVAALTYDLSSEKLRELGTTRLEHRETPALDTLYFGLSAYMS